MSLSYTKRQINIPLEEFKKDQWVMSEKNGYMKFMAEDSSNISVTTWNHLTIGMHSHAFYEFALIVKGSCLHSYKGVDIPLLSGDVVLIAPNEKHGYPLGNAAGSAFNRNVQAEKQKNKVLYQAGRLCIMKAVKNYQKTVIPMQ